VDVVGESFVWGRCVFKFTREADVQSVKRVTSPLGTAVGEVKSSLSDDQISLKDIVVERV